MPFFALVTENRSQFAHQIDALGLLLEEAEDLRASKLHGIYVFLNHVFVLGIYT
jgi:hypothetical protein